MNTATRPEAIAVAVAALRQAKADETAAIERRRAIEDTLVALLPAEGEGTVTDKDHGVTVTFKLLRKVDSHALTAAWADLPTTAQAAFNWKAEVSVTALRELEKTQPAVATAVLHFITTSPARPAVTLKAAS